MFDVFEIKGYARNVRSFRSENNHNFFTNFSFCHSRSYIIITKKYTMTLLFYKHFNVLLVFFWYFTPTRIFQHVFSDFTYQHFRAK